MAITSPPPEIFKAYDVRGIYGEEMDGETAYILGRGLRRLLGQLRGKPTENLGIGLGRDMRLTAPEMAGRFAEGIMEEGCHVLDAGEVGTEILYFLVGSREPRRRGDDHRLAQPEGLHRREAGARGRAAALGRRRDRRPARHDRGGPPEEAPGRRARSRWSTCCKEFQEGALAMIRGGETVKPMKLVVDGGNGMAGPMVGPLLEHLKMEVTTSSTSSPTATSPTTSRTRCSRRTASSSRRRSRDEGADLGIAWDGDADRCFFIDSEGTFVDGDFLTALLAESLLAKKGGGHILYDVRASRAVRDTVEAAGGTSELNRVGHAFFKARMRETGAIFGGEVSGHYYFKDFFCADSGTIPAMLDARAALREGRIDGRADEGLPLQVLHLRRDQLRGR